MTGQQNGSTPECDKWAKVHEDSVVIQQFFEFLSSKGINLCYMEKTYEQFLPVMQTHDDLIYEYFEIDRSKLEQERRAILEKCRTHYTALKESQS